ncbi:MAG: asparagine synthetase B [Crocinitomicaceae bacterium]|nr:asparagine synthetase B [Crocinitomicaceae bacterium]MBP6032005.1 asparagine synthetase B [Crocinitomicaceae bacterium]
MRLLLLSFCFLLSFSGRSTQLLIPMDESQTDHLKAYGIAFYCLKNNVTVEWLLNYRGGSFLVPHLKTLEEELIIRNVRYQVLADGQVNQIRMEISNPEVNMEIVQLEKAPKIAVYTPPNKQPWDDAVTLVLEYAEIPYDKIYDSAIVMGLLPKYDWLHLHHEDFTGQYGKFYANARYQAWYQDQVAVAERNAKMLGFSKVSELKLAVAQNLKNFVIGGGFLFTMCSGTDSFDIALAAQGVDMCASVFDGDAADPRAQEKLNFNQTFAFQDFHLIQDPMVYEYSDIDASDMRIKGQISQKMDQFTLFDFSAKWDVVPTMLTQCHVDVVNGFMGQTTDFRKELIKSNVLILGENKAANTARYIHGEMGQGTWTFYGGHDPEDYQHYVGDPFTDLSLHPNSPGYRLILNNILFPAAKKKKRKT